MKDNKTIVEQEPKQKSPQHSILAMSMSQKSSSVGSAIVEKLTSEQLPLFFQHVENRENEEHKNARLIITLSFIALLVVIFFFIFVVWLLKDSTLTKEIIIGLISFLGGGGLGFGIGANKK